MGTLGLLNPRLAPTEKAMRDDIIWAAGIYEGEGHAAALGRYPCAVVTIPQKGRWLPARLRSLFGGSVSPEQKSGIFIWTICGARARGFLMSVYGLLSPRRQEQARKVLRSGYRAG